MTKFAIGIVVAIALGNVVASSIDISPQTDSSLNRNAAVQLIALDR